jgi:hypothetical protein
MSERKKQSVCGNRRFLLSHRLFGFIACDPQLKLFQNITSCEALKLREGEARLRKIKARPRAKVQLCTRRQERLYGNVEQIDSFCDKIDFIDRLEFSYCQWPATQIQPPGRRTQ